MKTRDLSSFAPWGRALSILAPALLAACDVPHDGLGPVEPDVEGPPADSVAAPRAASSSVPPSSTPPADPVARTEDADRSASPVPPTSCPPPPACDVPFPSLGAGQGFRHTGSRITAALGSPRHRGRDQLLRAGARPWVIGKFAYGTFDKDIHDEDVDVFLLRDCAGPWVPVATTRTTADGEHAPVLGVEDDGGRIFVDLEASGVAPLAVGRHKVAMVVKGDHSVTEQLIEVLPSHARIVVTDIDGTLTASEGAAASDILGVGSAEPRPAAATLMHTFVSRGYYVLYLTARPEWMRPITGEWLAANGFPVGAVRTTQGFLGAQGTAAADYKAAELAALADGTGVVPSYGFGNKDSDVDAYARGGIPAAGSYYIELDADLRGGNPVSSYGDVVPAASSAPLACF